MQTMLWPEAARLRQFIFHLFTITILLSCIISTTRCDDYPFEWSSGDVEYSCEGLGTGWVVVGSYCFYAYSANNFTRSEALALCTSADLHYSSAAIIDNWLLARQLRTRIPALEYWTGIEFDSNSSDLVLSPLLIHSSMYNPLWNQGQPPTRDPWPSCLSLVVSPLSIGWRLSDCASALPPLCQTFACLPDEFRCADNSGCVPGAALQDTVAHCPDGSDNLPSSRRTKQVSQSHFSSCSHVTMTSPVGVVSTPNYPLQYPVGTDCLWEIVTNPAKIIVITIPSLSLAPSDSLVIRGNNPDDVISLTGSHDPLSHISRSHRISIRFKTGGTETRNGFTLNYYTKVDTPCPLSHDGSILFDSLSTPFDCHYDLHADNPSQYILLMCAPLAHSSNTSLISVSSPPYEFQFSSANHSQAVVIPSDSAHLSIRNLWTHKRKSEVHIRVFYLDADTAPLLVEHRGLSLHWPQMRQYSIATRHTLTLAMSQATNHTWTVDGISRTGRDTVELHQPPSSPISISSSISLRGTAESFLTISQEDTTFALNIKYSTDCPSIAPSPSLFVSSSCSSSSSSSSSPLGSCLSFSCPAPSLSLIGAPQSQCKMGGVWSQDTPICSAPPPPPSDCLLPVISDGFPLSLSVPSSGSPLYLTFGCNTGFFSSSGNSSACLSDGSWSPQTTCQPIICPAPDSIHLGAELVNSSTKYGYGSIVYYKRPDYQYATVAQRICGLANGKPGWLDFGFRAVDKGCLSPPLPFGQFPLPYYEEGRETAYNCVSGFSSNGVEMACVDAKWNGTARCHEIPTNSSSCGDHGVVVKVTGGYICNCDEGYDMEEGYCQDVDECLLGISLCDSPSLCHNLPGSYQCSCPPGCSLFMGEGDSEEGKLIVNRSCINLCSLEALQIQQQDLLVEQWKNEYRPGDVISLFCRMSFPSMGGKAGIVEYSVNCTDRGWNVSTNPCNVECPTDLPDLIVETKQPIRLFDEVSLSCPPSQLLIGPSFSICGYGGVYTRLPKCDYQSCSNLTLLANSCGYSILSSDPAHPFRVGVTVYIDSNPPTNFTNMTCELDSDGFPQWTPLNGNPFNCGGRSQDPPMTERDVNLISSNIPWIFSPDWLLSNSTWTKQPCVTTSFLISPAIALLSDSVRVEITASWLSGGQLTAAIYSSPFTTLPALPAYQPIGSISGRGTLSVQLDYLSSFLSLYIHVDGSASIDSILLVYDSCPQYQSGNLTINSTLRFSQYRNVEGSCGNRDASLVARCGPTGWQFENTKNPCCSNTCAPLLDERPDVSKCDPNVCWNGICEDGDGVGRGHHDDDGWRCQCNQDWIPYNDNMCMPDYDSFVYCSPTGSSGFQDGQCKCKPKFTPNDDDISCSCIEETSPCDPRCPNDSCLLAVYLNQTDVAVRACLCNSTNHVLFPCDVGPSPSPAHIPATCPCENGGSCMGALPGTTPCQCPTGFVGELCSARVGCLSRADELYCKNGAECSYQDGNVTCRCSEGWSGPRCDKLSNYCSDINCGRGQCLSYMGGAFCLCNPGYMGGNCQNTTDICTYSNPCRDPATCTSNTTVPFCDCGSHYSDPFCDMPSLDPCDSTICGPHGKCVSTAHWSHSCVCDQGWRIGGASGQCDTRIEYCTLDPCSQESQCRELNENGYNCTCLQGYTGPSCSIPIDLCQGWNCGHGHCDMKNGSAECICDDGYEGVHCEKEKVTCDCLNGGVCVSTPSSTLSPVCSCPPDTHGDRCQYIGRSCTTGYCQNGGTCINDTYLNAYCICDVGYTGDICDTVLSSSFNLFFNGLPSSQDIVTKQLISSLYREFTLCGWVFYSPPHRTNLTDVLPPFISIVSAQNTQTVQEVIRVDNQGVSFSTTRFIRATLPINGWHHVCLRSPEYHSSGDRYVWTYYVDGVGVANETGPPMPSQSTQYMLWLNPQKNPASFQGEISMVQLYSSRLSDTEIAEMVFECVKWNENDHPDLLLHWTDFTSLLRTNPGVEVLSPGICVSSNCLPGWANCASPDKIPPVVERCPSDILRLSPSRLTVVTWDDQQMFSDNRGIQKITSNFRPGQAFPWGISHVIYRAFDESSNTAICSFDVVISPSDCRPADDHPDLGYRVNMKEVNGTDSARAAFIECLDQDYPTQNPRFFVCDRMGQWERDSPPPLSMPYWFPGCGRTVPSEQTVNGTVQTEGECQKIHDTLNATLSSDLSDFPHSLVILPDCLPNERGKRDNGLERDADESYTFHYWINTNASRSLLSPLISSSINSSFPSSNSSLSSSHRCPASHPVETLLPNGNFVCGDCPAGTKWSPTDKECVDCPIDTYRSSSNQSIDICLSCPEGTTTAGVARVISISGCVPICEVGEFFNVSSSICSKCPQGTYQSAKGKAECLSCPLYTSTPMIGATSQEDCSFTCGAGTELDKTGSLCEDCEKGTYKTSTKGACTPCPIGLSTLGTKSRYLADCEVPFCPSNYHIQSNISFPVSYNSNFASICARCEMGTYQPQPNQTSCIPCVNEDSAPTCVLSSQCNPSIASSCSVSNVCVSSAARARIYSCQAQQTPRSPSHSTVIWSVVGVAILIIVLVIAAILWIYRQKLICCKGVKRFETTQYYRNPRRRNRRTSVQPSDTVSVISSVKASSVRGAPLMIEEAPTPIIIERPLVRARANLPPPIITSRSALDALEMRADAQSTPPTRWQPPRDTPLFTATPSFRPATISPSIESTMPDEDDDYFG